MATSTDFGLNKSRRLSAERAATQENLASLLLTPDFPYTPTSFDPDFFGLGDATSPADPLTSPAP